MDTKGKLLHRWKDMEEEEEEDNHPSTDHSSRLRFQQLKEEWFSDAFNFLIHLSKQNHIWCGSWDLMGPLLETFYNYFEDERFDSPLKILWKRISEELRCCTQCICQHHQAQESYSMEYESNSIGPLIVVLRSLDEERVTAHLKEINSKVARGDYDSVRDNAEVVSVMFEVLKFPVLLDDQSLVPEFQIFIEAVDNYHELTLDGHEQYPGVYALLFLKSIRARSIGLRLAKHLGKLRKAEDLEPLQPLLKRYICFLETEVLPPSTARTYRPRVKLERSTVWQGIKTLLGFLEPPAFEEGILEHYNMFPNIVVNHLSDDSLEFSYAVNCLRILFEMLGCKLWLMSSLSPSIMRNTLLSQCFHTRNEKSHKDIFDLFQPFLQSLEALQDGEHEKERRHFLYFLLHQVTVSSNFSMLMRKKACQIALRIIHRGYQMNPPCPPFECAHMWGPSLVSSLKDLSLHSSLRQPAFDLIQTIIVSDAAALVSASLNTHTPPIIDGPMSTEFNDEDEDQGGLPFARDVGEKKDNSCWKEFSAEGKIAAQEYGCWMCIPMLWAEVLIEIDPLMLPVSFSKAVFWSLSRLSMLEPLNSSEMVLPVRNWLTTYASEISYLFGWKAPSGSDDGGDGKESKNSAKVSTVCVPLMRTFKRLSTDYVVKMEQGEVWKQWNWEPRMGESLILLLVDPDDNARQVARRMLEKVSKVRTLACGLQFLCSCSSSLSAIFFGLRHALKLVQLDAVLLKFQMLHNFFFVLCKVLKEGITYSETQADDATKDSTRGGFLQQPVFDSLPNDNNTGGHLQNVDSTSWEMFSCLLSVIAWPSILKCLAEGKAFIDCKTSQMTCIRLLETVPIVFERLRPSFHRLSRNVGGMIVEYSRNDFKWLLDLMDWGKSRLAVIVRYWKQTVLSLLGQLKWSCSDNSVSMIRVINKIITSDNVSMDELAEHVSRLSVSLVNEEGSYKFEKTSMMKSGPLFTDGLLPKTKCISKSAVVEDAVVQTVLDSASSVNKEEKNKVIIVSDDDMDTEIPAIGFHHGSSSQPMLDGSSILDNHGASERVVQCDLAKGENISCIETSLKMLKTSNKTGASDSCGFVSQKLVESEATKRRASLLRPKAVENIRKDTTTSSLNKNGNDSVTYQNKLKNGSNDTISKRIADSFPSQLVSTNVEKNSSYNATTNTTKTSGQYSIKKVSKTAANIVIRELVHDSDDDPLELALKAAAAGRQQASIAKVNACGPKRQVIQLNLPVENRFANLHRMDGQQIRFKPPKLDDWYKPILELDYFATVGLTPPPTEEEDNKTASKLKEVPVSFQSPDEYVSIFRPLVLEEFKAQLQSSFIEVSSSGEMCCGSLSVMSVERVDDFHIVRCVHDDIDASGSKRCVENDLILLTRQQFRSTSQDVHMVGKVEKREKDNNRRSNILAIRFYFQNGVPRLNRARKLLLERSKWFISRLVSITPQLREFQALSSIRNIPLLPLILNPTNHPSGRSESREKYLTKLSTPLQQILKLSFNDSQVQAISAGIGPVDLKMDFGLSLIQGPPGTGKTRTIVAIVSGLLAMRRMIDKKRQNDDIKATTSNNTSYVNKKVPMSQSAAIARAWQDAALARQVNDDELGKKGKFVGSSSCTTKGRVLICAQSNAAVDELVSRISNEGLYGSDGVMYKPYLVRVGNAKTVHPNSLPFFIDTLVEHRLAKERRINVMGDPKNEDSSSTVLHSNLEKLADRISFYEAKRANLRDDGNNSGSKGLLLEGEVVHPNVKEMSDAEIGARLRKLYADRQAVSRDIAAAQAREKKVDEESRALKHKLRKSILREAEIVVTTLSGCGGDLYAVCSETISSQKFGSSLEHTLFDAVVIDEAAQALEPATLIPLQLLKSKWTKCIMVGDPKQLPATVLSNVASKYMYQCSMFERLQRAGHPVLMLTKQYRMHPEICRFPSQHFYDGKLLNGDDMSTREVPPFHKTEFLGPYVFFDIVDGQELRGNNFGASSFYNECEADAAVEILKYFRRRHTSDFSGGRIGIVTPYKGQLSLLRQRFSYTFGSSVTAEMEFNTVDGFQGREVDILILSTVRGMGPPCSTEHRIKESSSSNIGFVADARRMNVALTRAKHSLWILGNARTLMTNKNWEALVWDARKRHLVISIKKPYTSMFSNNAAWKKSPILERSDADHSTIQLSEEVGGLAEQQHKKVANSSDKRKRTCIGGGRRDVKNIVVGREEHTSFPSKGEADKATTRRRKAKSEHNDGLSSVKKDLGTAVEDSSSSPNKTVNLRKSSIATGNKSRGQMSNEKQQSDVGNSDMGNGEGHQKLVKKAVSLNGVTESFENDKSQRQSMDIDKNPVRRSFQERRDVTLDKALASKHQFENSKQDSIAKRKQQREAVDALLSSALISTKKSSLPVKRPISPTNAAAGHSIKPPKPRKVTEGYKREMGPGAGGVER